MKVGDVVQFYLGKAPNRHVKSGYITKVNSKTVHIRYGKDIILRKISRDIVK